MQGDSGVNTCLVLIEDLAKVVLPVSPFVKR